MQRRQLEEEVENREEERAKKNLDSDEESEDEAEVQRKAKEALTAKYIGKKEKELQQPLIDPTAVLEVPKTTLKREPLEAQRRGPMMVRRTAAGNPDASRNREMNDMLSQLKQEEKKVAVEDKRTALERGLSFTGDAHRNISKLKSSSQLRNIASLV